MKMNNAHDQARLAKLARRAFILKLKSPWLASQFVQDRN